MKRPLTGPRPRFITAVWLACLSGPATAGLWGCAVSSSMGQAEAQEPGRAGAVEQASTTDAQATGLAEARVIQEQNRRLFELARGIPAPAAPGDYQGELPPKGGPRATIDRSRLADEVGSLVRLAGSEPLPAVSAAAESASPPSQSAVVAEASPEKAVREGRDGREPRAARPGTDRESAAAARKKAVVRMVAVNWLNIRSAPAVNAPLVGGLTRGSTFQVTFHGDWARLAEGKWVLAKHLRSPAVRALTARR